MEKPSDYYGKTTPALSVFLMLLIQPLPSLCKTQRRVKKNDAISKQGEGSKAENEIIDEMALLGN